MPSNPQQHREHLLLNLLQLTAAPSAADVSITRILEMAQSVTGAAGAAFQVPGDWIARVTVGDMPTQETDSDIADTPGLLVYPVSAGDVTDAQASGVLSLAVDSAYAPDESEQEALAALVTGLAIVVQRAWKERESRRSWQLTLSVLQAVTDPLLIFDEQWRLVLANPAATAVFGAAASAGASLADAVQSEELASMARGKHPPGEWIADERTFMPHVEMIRGTAYQPEGWILVLADVTRYKKLSRNQSEFVRIVSHDVRSPLTSIQGFASMLGMVGELSEKQKYFVDKVLSGITQITTLVDNIQDAGRFDMETGFYDMVRAECDLREMVSRIVGSFLIPAEKQELTVSTAVAADAPILNADANMLERAITNLVDNAIKYTPNGGQVNVNVYCANRSVIVAVSDTGLGIRPEHQKQLFQRHVRIPRQEHKRIKGTGLGLFIVKSVAQRHGGDAWVESADGKGSTFYISIPLEGANLVLPDAD